MEKTRRRKPSKKRETVIARLKELIRKSKREELRGLAGGIRLKVDLTRSRERRRRT